MKHHHKWTIALALAVAVAIIFYATRLGNDDEITQHVVDALRNHPAVNAPDLQISFEDGVVTLTGTFPDAEARRVAIAEAQKIRGVRRVVDQTVIAVEPEKDSPDDAPDAPVDAAVDAAVE